MPWCAQHGWTPLDWAKRKEHSEVIALLEEVRHILCFYAPGGLFPSHSRSQALTMTKQQRVVRWGRAADVALAEPQSCQDVVNLIASKGCAGVSAVLRVFDGSCLTFDGLPVQVIYLVFWIILLVGLAWMLDFVPGYPTAF